MEEELVEMLDKYMFETVENFLRDNPDVTVDMMTPSGYVHLTPEQGQALLNGDSVPAHLGVSETFHEISARELLGQEICTVKLDESDKKHFFLLSNYPERTEQRDQNLSAAENAPATVKPVPKHVPHL